MKSLMRKMMHIGMGIGCFMLACMGVEVFAATVSSEIQYSSYFGGNGVDEYLHTCVDSQGYVYLVGSTSSTNLPITNGVAYHGGATDGFVTKFNPDGKTIIYCVYIGGSDEDGIAGITVDDQGYAYITGATHSADFQTTTNAWDRTLSGDRDAVVLKLNASGDITYSTYVGGSEYDYGYCIATENEIVNGNDEIMVYFGGFTHGGYPITQGAAQQTFGGDTEGFITKLHWDVNGTTMVYSTYLGGNGHDGIKALMVEDGILYATGHAGSSSFPTTTDALDRTNIYFDGYFSVLAQDGQSFIYSTFIGPENTSLKTEFREMAKDSAGNIYLVGLSQEADFETTADAEQRNYAGDGDGILVKLSPDYHTVLYSTFLGGNGTDYCTDVAIATDGTLWVTGYTESTDFPAGSTVGGGKDVFVLHLDANGKSLWSARFGGSQDEAGDMWGLDIAISSLDNKVWIGARSVSSDYPVTTDAQQPVSGGGQDVVLTSVKDVWDEHFDKDVFPSRPSNWRDGTTNPELNMDAKIEYSETTNQSYQSYATIKRLNAEQEMGRVQSPVINAPDLNVFKYVEISIADVEPDTVWKLRVIEDEPVNPEIKELCGWDSRVGTFSFMVYDAENATWQGKKRFRIEVDIAGKTDDGVKDNGDENDCVVLDYMKLVVSPEPEAVAVPVATSEMMTNAPSACLAHFMLGFDTREYLYMFNMTDLNGNNLPDGWYLGADAEGVSIGVDSLKECAVITKTSSAVNGRIVSDGKEFNTSEYTKIEVEMAAIADGCSVLVEMFDTDGVYKPCGTITSAGCHEFEIDSLWGGAKATYGIALTMTGDINKTAVIDRVAIFKTGWPGWGVDLDNDGSLDDQYEHNPANFTSGEKRDIASVYYPFKHSGTELYPTSVQTPVADALYSQMDNALIERQLLYFAPDYLALDGGMFDLKSYYILNDRGTPTNTSWDREVMYKYLAELKAAGKKAVPVYEDKTHFKWTQNLQSRAVAVSRAKRDMLAWLHLFNKSEFSGVQYKVMDQGIERPVVFVFSYEGLHPNDEDTDPSNDIGRVRLSADELYEWLNTYIKEGEPTIGIPAWTGAKPLLVTNVIKTEFPDSLEGEHTYRQVFEGYCEWPDIFTGTENPEIIGRHTLGEEKSHWQLKSQMIRHAVHLGIYKFICSGAWPGFDDGGVRNWGEGTWRVIPRVDGDDGTYDFHATRIRTENYPVKQVVTFNDWWEGTNVEPSLEFYTIYGVIGAGAVNPEIAIDKIFIPLEKARNAVAAINGIGPGNSDMMVPYWVESLRGKLPINDSMQQELDSLVAEIHAGTSTSAETTIETYMSGIDEWTPTCSPTLTPVVTKTPTSTPTPTPTPANVYWTDFVGTAGERPEGWRDDTTDSTFECTLGFSATSSLAQITRTAENVYGKVLSPIMTCDVDVYPFIELKVTDVPVGTGWILGIQEEEGTYQAWNLHTTQNDTGTYHINFADITGWTGTGTHTFSVCIVVEGAGGSSITVDHLRVGGDETAQGGMVISVNTATPTPTPTVTMTPTKTPTQVVSTATATPTMTPTATATPWLQEKDVMAYPNPARNKVNFAYTISGEAKVVIDIYKLTGERVANITEQVNGGAGQTLSTAWDAVDVAPGIYFCRIVITDNSGKQVFKINKKVALIK